MTFTDKLKDAINILKKPKCCDFPDDFKRCDCGYSKDTSNSLTWRMCEKENMFWLCPHHKNYRKG